MEFLFKVVGLQENVEKEIQLTALVEDVDENPKSKHELEKARGPRALTFLHLAIPNSIFSGVIKCKTAKQLLDKL